MVAQDEGSVRVLLTVSVGFLRMATGELSTRIATGIEAVLTSALSVAVLLVVVDFGRIYWREARLQRGVAQVAALVAGGVLPASSPETLAAELERLGGLREIRPGDVAIVSVNWKGIETEGPGEPGDVLTVRARDRVKLLTPHLAIFFEDGRYRVSATKSVRAEAAGPVLIGG